jgi:hypothetical protein
MEQKHEEQGHNFDNFLAQPVLQKFKADNHVLSNFLNRSNKMVGGKKKIWRQSKLQTAK